MCFDDVSGSPDTREVVQHRHGVPKLSIRIRFTHCPECNAPKGIRYGIHKNMGSKLKQLVFFDSTLPMPEYEVVKKLGSNLSSSVNVCDLILYDLLSQ